MSFTLTLLTPCEFKPIHLCCSSRITLTHKNKPFVQCKPLIIGQTLYWLDVLTTMVEARSIEAIYKVDYDLIHRRLGHPSKEVLKRAKDHTKGFPDGIIITTTYKMPWMCARQDACCISSSFGYTGY